MSKLFGVLVLVAVSAFVGAQVSQEARGQVSRSPWGQFLSLVYLDDGTGTQVPTVQVNGANFRIVNGLGATQTQNSAGNLIVGYNEFGNPNGDDRTGSHNSAFGEANSFSSFGGMVGSKDNTVSGPFASVGGGRDNIASGDYSSVSGGEYNTASGSRSSVTAGRFNTASDLFSSVSGGESNCAYSSRSSISGGRNNRTTGSFASVSGGMTNTASGYAASVTGGVSNTASGNYSSISGGRFNYAIGYYSSVSGGNSRLVTGTDDWAAGSLFEDY